MVLGDIDFNDQWILNNANRLAAQIDSKIKSMQFSLPQSNNTQFGGKHNRSKAGSGSDFWQFREHANGEELRNIAWRKSAKSDKVILKEFEVQKPLKIQFWCDNSPQMNWSSVASLPKKSNFALLLAMAIISYLKLNNEMAAIISSKPFNRQNAINLNSLRHAGARLPQNFSAGSAIIITDGLGEISWFKEMLLKAQKAKCKIILLVIHDSNEREFNFEGRIEFRPFVDGFEPILVEDCQSIKSDFCKSYNAHFAELARLANEFKAEFIEGVTKDDAFQKCLEICILLSKRNRLVDI